MTYREVQLFEALHNLLASCENGGDGDTNRARAIIIARVAVEQTEAEAAS